MGYFDKGNHKASLVGTAKFSKVLEHFIGVLVRT